MSRTHPVAALCAIAVATACSGTSEVIEKSERFASQRNYYQAYWVIEGAKETYPKDPELERVYWERRKDYHLDQGRELLFAEEEEKAIAELQKVFVLDPDNRSAKAMIARCKFKLASRAAHAGDELRYSGDLEGALKAYNEATRYVAEFPQALEGIKEVNKQYSDLAKKAMEHYVLGSRARGLRPPSYVRSWYHSGLAKEFDSSLERATRLRETAARRVAEDRFLVAKTAEEKGYHAAALSDYRAIQTIYPDLAGLKERIAICEKEVEARDMCDKARTMILKDQFEEADKLLAKAFDIAVGGDVKARVSSAMADSKRRRFRQVYLQARDKQIEWRLEAALADFKTIQEEFANKGGFEDVDERVSTITNAITEATDAWQKGKAHEEKGELQEAINLYSEALAVYRGFKDLDTKVEQLRARLK